MLHNHTFRRDDVIHRARKLVQEDPVRFTLAGQRLDELFSEESVRKQDQDPLNQGEKYAVEVTPEQVLFMRLGAALDCFRYPEMHRYDNHLDFESIGDIDDRRMAARMAVLVMLASIDANKEEVITEAMGNIATIPYEIRKLDDGMNQLAFGGSEWIVWNEEKWNHSNEPSPRLIKRFQNAIDVARHGSSEAARRNRIPSGDGRPCDHNGENRYDEAERALRDVGRFVGHFHYFVNQWRNEWPYRFEKETQRKLNEIMLDNRSWWTKWPGVINRAREAIRAIDLPELANAKQRAFDGIAYVAALYQDPLFYHEHEEPGDNLTSAAYNDFADPHKAEQAEEIVKALNDFDPLRRGCLLYIHESDGLASSDQSEQDESKPGGKRTDLERIRDERILAEYLCANPLATRLQASQYVGVSTGTISSTHAWKVFKETQKQARREARPVSFENLDELADPKSATIRDADGARALDSSKIKATNARRY